MTDLQVVVCVTFDHRASFDGIRSFKDCVCACPFVDAVMEVEGPYDMIVEARFATLGEYSERMESIAPQLAEFASRVEANFVGRKHERMARQRSFWVPCPDGRRRIDEAMVNKIVAEGDYMRLCTDDSEYLVHGTMGHLVAQLDGEQFLQLHRSAVVRVNFVDRIIRRGRRLVAQLHDGTDQIVAKSHSADVLRLISGDPAKHQPRPSKIGDADRNSHVAERNPHEEIVNFP